MLFSFSTYSWCCTLFYTHIFSIVIFLHILQHISYAAVLSPVPPSTLIIVICTDLSTGHHSIPAGCCIGVSSFTKPSSAKPLYTFAHYSIFPTTTATYAPVTSSPRSTVRTSFGRFSFQFAAPNDWNELQKRLKLRTFIPLSTFDNLLRTIVSDQCTCFWFAIGISLLYVMYILWCFVLF